MSQRKVDAAVTEGVFAVILTKTRLSDAGAVLGSNEWEEARESLLTIIGTIGWHGTTAMLGSCLRMWAEVPGIVPVPRDVQEICHGLAQSLGRMEPEARLIDRAALRPKAKKG